MWKSGQVTSDSREREDLGRLVLFRVEGYDPTITHEPSSIQPKAASMSPAPGPQDDPQLAVNAYFNGLAAKDVSRVPWADNATLRTPLNPAGGESELIRGRKAILDFFAGILPALRSVSMVRHYASEAGWVAGQAEIALSNGKTLYVLDAFFVQKGEIIEQQNHYDPRAATG